ncbi:MAG TPA: ribose 5-phosphate isomerase B [Gemmatales bacterium]|nr:ribose 5-phosphate isomerase B [Gemmatales bacterium]
MRIAIAGDHRGFELKKRLITSLTKQGHTVDDKGTSGPESCDYPDLAFLVGEAVGLGQADRGILICGTGIGMCIAANKVLGVRAANCHDLITAELSRRHNDANVLCLSGDLLGGDMVERVVKAWLTTDFETNSRHSRRVDKIIEYGKIHISR